MPRSCVPSNLLAPFLFLILYSNHLTCCNENYWWFDFGYFSLLGPLGRDGKSRQFAFIGFRTEEEAQEAIKYFNKSYIDTCRIACEVCGSILVLSASFFAKFFIFILWPVYS